MKLTATAFLELFQGFRDFFSCLIDAVGGHGIKGVSDRNQSGT